MDWTIVILTAIGTAVVVVGALRTGIRGMRSARRAEIQTMIDRNEEKQRMKELERENRRLRGLPDDAE